MDHEKPQILRKSATSKDKNCSQATICCHFNSVSCTVLVRLPRPASPEMKMGYRVLSRQSLSWTLKVKARTVEEEWRTPKAVHGFPLPTSSMLVESNWDKNGDCRAHSADSGSSAVKTPPSEAGITAKQEGRNSFRSPFHPTPIHPRFSQAECMSISEIKEQKPVPGRSIFAFFPSRQSSFLGQ
ncbi:hypothetical protein H6P81_010794 [Aristolochia fimbriata]|uniref:Uncharacterized protein n=1 Tax=Aristolochia fimbriata TaxID=158543 RepID=A0AAV7EQF0_ARIFI|nr:hypothetical protein H6P81_010794 [Aristolochia fimbriata]